MGLKRPKPRPGNVLPLFPPTGGMLVTGGHLPYGGEAPHVAHSDTSKAAACQMTPLLNDLQRKVLHCIETAQGATCDQVEQQLGLKHQTASARMRELYLRGFITDTGQRRRTRSGRQAAIWQRVEGDPKPPKRNERGNETLKQELKRLRRERNTWKARALGLGYEERP